MEFIMNTIAKQVHFFLWSTMNESLINPFTLTHPTAVQTSLFALALFARWDPSGRYLAAGRADGSAAVWDLETRAQVRALDGHVRAVTAVDWSRNSRFVLTASKDWNAIVWDLAGRCEPPQRYATVRFDAPVSSAAFHPRNSRIVLAVTTTGEAYLTDLRREHRARVELCEPSNDTQDQMPTRTVITVARFDPAGKHIFAGTAVGTILVFHARTKALVARHKIVGAGMMKGLDFAKSGRRMVTNSSDRTLRQFQLPAYAPAGTRVLEQELEPTHRFTDPINKTAWHAMSFSPDGEWLAGGAADAATHKIYIWDISNDGQFATTLDGGREPLVHLHWHPSKSTLASTTNQGNVLVWHCPSTERWGAFAGGFEEVDENVEYEEREDEFDIEDEETIRARKMKAEDEPVDIDSVRAPPSLATSAADAGADEDAAWADEDPDKDLGGWRMRVVMEEDGDI